MGSMIEFNDTLQLTTEQGFPRELDFKRHLRAPFQAADFKGRAFPFRKPNIRLYHPSPTRVFLVHNLGGKWLHWGKAHVVEQTIHAEAKETSGTFTIALIYTLEQMRLMNAVNTDKGKMLPPSFWLS